LTGVIVHDGDAYEGHYYSFIAINGVWYCFNDMSVSPYPQRLFRWAVFGGSTGRYEDSSPSAYLLFYSRSGLDSSYAFPNEELAAAIPPARWEAIQAENRLYAHNQAVFSEPMCEFVLDSLTELGILCEYFVNIILHSRSAASADTASEKIIRLLKADRAAIADTAGFFVANQKTLLEAFQFCANDDILKCLSRLLTVIVKSAPTDAAFVHYFMENMFEMVGPCRRLPFMMRPITKCITVAPLSVEVQEEYAQRIVDFIGLLFAGKKTAGTLQELDLEDLFNSLAMLFDVMTEERFRPLLLNADHILSSPQSASFVRANLASDVHTNLIMAIIILADDDDDLLVKLTDLDDFVTWEDIVETIRRFAHHEDFKSQVIDHWDLLLLRYLTADDPLLRDASERAVASLFGLLPLNREDRAEFLLCHPGLAAFDGSSSGGLLDEADFDAFAKLMADLCECCRDFAAESGAISELIDGDDEPQTRFTFLLRCLRLALTRSDISNGDLPPTIWALFVAVSNSSACGGCYLLEFVRLFAALPEEDRVVLLSARASEFVRCVFPIPFTSELKLAASTLINVLQLTHFLLPEFQTDPLFLETYRLFTARPLQNASYGWITTRVVSLVLNNAGFAEAVVSLLEDGFPIAWILVVVAANAPLDEAAFGRLLDAVVRACDERPARPSATKALLTSQLFELLLLNLKRFPTVAAPIASLLSAYLTPSSAPYAAAMQAFIVALADRDESLRVSAFDLLVGCKEDVEQDVRVVWNWLALRLRLCRSDREKADCLEDAVDAAGRYEEGRGLTFAQAVLAAWSAGGGAHAGVLRRFVAAAGKTNVWRQTTAAEIVAAAQGSGEIIDAFRMICDHAHGCTRPSPL
jgi:hypothetical protein